MKTFAFVFARGGSKGISRKNLQILHGKPLLAWSIEMGQSLSEVERVFVSTEDAEIAEVARKLEAEVITRPMELAQDNSSEWLAWQHAIKTAKKIHGSFDCFLSLPTTAPLRDKIDVKQCLERLDENTDVVITMTPASRNPRYNMVCEEKSGELRLLIEGDYVRRQDAPLGYDVTTVAYTLRPDFILRNQRMWDGRVRGVEIPGERALDIDTPLDLEIARFLSKKKNFPWNKLH